MKNLYLLAFSCIIFFTSCEKNCKGKEGDYQDGFDRQKDKIPGSTRYENYSLSKTVAESNQWTMPDEDCFTAGWKDAEKGKSNRYPK